MTVHDYRIAPRADSLLNITWFLAICSLAVMFSVSAEAAYKLVWSDEFNEPQIDTTNWEHQVFPGHASGNNELQYYTDRPENSYIENGCLVIQALKENYKDHKYTSARLSTAGKRDFLYGKMEARIKLPSGKGMWPAFWMMPTDSEYGIWAASGEIDIMEALNDHPDEIMGTIHFGGSWPHQKYAGKQYHPAEPTDFSADFHVYALEWQPHEMRWYVDGNLYSVQTEWNSENGPYPAPFDKRFHFIINLAVGGTLPDPPDETTPWPQRMYVDWIRVYQTDNRTPEVEITSPEDGVKLPAGSPILIEATASDPDGNLKKVEFYDGDVLLGDDCDEPYRFEWSADDGYYTIRARAVDEDNFASTDTVEVIQGAGSVQSPYHKTPVAVPGKIEAEDFDVGMPGDAYWDTDKINHGGEYRRHVQVDIQRCDEGGYDIGWVEDGEWLEYTVMIDSAGNYDITCRVASIDGAGRWRIEIGGIDITGIMNAPKTGDWQRFDNVIVHGVKLPGGKHVMRLVVEKGGFNVNYIQITKPAQN